MQVQSTNICYYFCQKMVIFIENNYFLKTQPIEYHS